MKHQCLFCNAEFNRKDNLTRHLQNNSCAVGKKMTLLDFHNKIEELQNSIRELSINGDHNTTNVNSPTINLNITINPITRLTLDYIPPEHMKSIIEQFDSDPSKFNLLFTNYLNNVLCNKEHPENHSIKYIKKYPPTFQSVIQDENGNVIDTIKGLKDTCDILTDPILDALKSKLKECIKTYKHENNGLDYDLYEDAIRELRKELKKDNIKKVLSSFLQHDMLNNIEMRLSANTK